MKPNHSTPEQLQADMEAARLDHEDWLANRRHGIRRPSKEPSPYDGCRTVEDDRLDDPRHGGV